MPPVKYSFTPIDIVQRPPQLGGGFCCDAIAEKWDSVEKYNQYCAFYEGLICAVLEYVQEMVPALLLHVPTVLVTLLTDLGAQGAPCL